jgi:hypothetical protein
MHPESSIHSTPDFISLKTSLKKRSIILAKKSGHDKLRWHMLVENAASIVHVKY